MRISKLLILVVAAAAGTLVYKLRHPSRPSAESGSYGSVYSSLTGAGSILESYRTARAGKSEPNYTLLGSNSGGIGAVGPNMVLGGLSSPLDTGGAMPEDDEDLLIDAAKGDKDGVTERLAANVKVDSRDVHHRTALMYAAWNGHNDICARLLAAGASLRQEDDSGFNALDYAAGRGLVETVQTLLKYAHAHDNRHYVEYASLIRAAYAGNAIYMPPGTGELASINRLTPDGMAPLYIAAGNGSVSLMEAMIQRGANVSLTNRQHQGPLHWAAWNNQPQSIAVLLGHGAVISPRDLSGNTPLMLAAQNNSTAAARMLVSHGADKYLANSEHKTAGMIAEEKGYKELAALLK